MKKLIGIERDVRPHWVGDGFPVRSVFSYHSHGAKVSPFLLLDYAGPAEFAPADKPRGVEEHPHRGFETVTIVYSGEVDHRDSAGGGGSIGPGDVQWMTAAGGLVHEEMHGREFTKRGGVLEMVQLWVNLPAKDKNDKPHYQAIAAAQIPNVELGDEAGNLRVIAGKFADATGPARTYTKLNLWDVRLQPGKRVGLPVPEGHNTMLLVLNGEVQLSTGEKLGSASLAIFDRNGEGMSLTTLTEAKLLVLTGEPIDEPIAGAGPFVMNTRAEIEQAFADYQSGRMGRIDA